MNFKNFIPSELKVTASKELDVSNDLNQPQVKSIGELLYEEETTEIAQESAQEDSEDQEDPEDIKDQT